MTIDFVNPPKFPCFRWLMMGIIGFSVGIVGFLLHQIIDIISEFKWELTSHYIQVNILSLTIENLFAKKRKEKIMD